MVNIKTTLSTAKPFRWIRPEVSPLFAFIGVALSAAVYMGARHIVGNPSVYVSRNRRSELDMTTDDKILKERGRSYSSSSAFQKLAHVNGTPDAWRDMEARQEAAAAPASAKST